MNNYECNICGWQGDRFHDIDCGHGNIVKGVICPKCHSGSRHRSFFLYLKKTLPDQMHLKLLHFAPENCFKDLFRSYLNIDYLSVDLNKDRAMKAEDITQLSFPDNSFDVILCFHVLEHVEDDHKAIKELHRVLNKDGFALIDVPIHYGLNETYEDDTITLPHERAKAFGQWDHVRWYGKDFPDRLRQNGFNVEGDYYIKSLDNEIIKRYNLMETPILFCTKRNKPDVLGHYSKRAKEVISDWPEWKRKHTAEGQESSSADK